MKNVICNSCEAKFSKDLEFCPKCGCYNEMFDLEQTQTNEKYNEHLKPKTAEEILIGMAKDISTVKKIMVFFTWLWCICVVLCILIIILEAN